MTATVALDKALMELASTQHGLVSRSQLLAIGISPNGIASRVSRGRLFRVARGVYSVYPVMGGDEGWLQRARAVMFGEGADCVLSHGTAARLLDLDLRLRRVIEVTVPHSCSAISVRGEVRVHRTRRLDESERVLRRGLPVTSPERTIADLAQRYTDVALWTALNDGKLREIIDLERLAALLDEPHIRTRPRSHVLRRELDLWRRHPELKSVAEADTARALWQAGIPEPVCQYKVCDGTEVVAIVDFAWPDLKVAVEMDGVLYHSSPRDREHDYYRANRLAALGWTVLRITPHGLKTGREAFLKALRERLGIPPHDVGGVVGRVQ